MNEFFTIKKATEGFYKEKGSKFLAFAYPVSSEETIKEKLEELKRKYYDARHHCFAYIIGLKDQYYRANDDGEPGHSAGDPILGQIRSKQLTNCLVIVVRYFGGTKLGVGGLITAYKTAAEAALEKAEIVTIYSQTRFRLVFDYALTSEVERILSEFQIEYLEKNYLTNCEFLALIRDEDVEALSGKLALCQGAELNILVE